MPVIKSFNKWVVLIGLPIIMWQCYWYVGFDQTITKMLNFIVSFIVLIFLSNKMISRRKSKYDKYVSGIVVLFIISLIVSYIYWEQSPFLSYRAGVGTLSILYYYVLKEYKVTKKEIIIVVFFFAIIYYFLWRYALSQAPNVVFGNLEEVRDTRGFYRILQLCSIDMVCLLYFIALVRIVIGPHKLIWFFTTVFCFIVIFLSLTRMLIFSVTIITILFLLRKNIKIAIVVLICFSLGYNRIMESDIITELIEITEYQIQDNEEHGLRMVEYQNALTAYPLHLGTIMFGNGVPHIESKYGQYDYKLKSDLGFNLSDAGYVGLYSNYGICMLLLFLFLLFHTLKSKVSIQYQPFRLFVIMLFLINITSYSFWSYGISFAISLYSLSLAEKEINREHSSQENSV